MTAATTTQAALAAGVTVKAEGDCLRLSAASRPDDRLVEEVRRGKTEIVAYLSDLAAWSEDDWRALYDERAGIMEYDGGASRAEAEEVAREEIDALRRLLMDGRA